MIHHLTEKDTAARTATCSVCGPVKIARAGNGWACTTKTRANGRKYARTHRRPYRGRHGHTLSWKDTHTRTGVCAKDGAVDIVPYGRGWICAARAKELGRVNNQEAPLQYCRDCWAETEGDAQRLRIWLRADGTCPRCAETDLQLEFAKMAADARLFAGVSTIDGIHVIGQGDPYEMPDYESVVPGWRTIGQPD